MKRYILLIALLLLVGVLFSHYRPTPLVDCSFSADPLCWRGK